MKTSIEYTKTDKKVSFSEISDKECFYHCGTLYMRILQQDLEFLNIKDINAISIINAGLTFFSDNEEVFIAEREWEQGTYCGI